MNKAELEKKPLSDLHSLAADAGVERFRMLSKTELVDRLADGDGGSSGGGSSASSSSSGGGSGSSSSSSSSSGGGSSRSRSRGGRGRGGSGSGEGGGRSRQSGSGRAAASADEDDERPRRRPRSGSGSGEREREASHEDADDPDTKAPAPTPAEPAADRSPSPSSSDDSPERPRRRRRRRRFGRRKDGISIQDLLLPPESGRQAVLVGETRAACTALLRGVAGDLAGDSKGPEPVALLIDPTPEELADWKREAPQAEIVSAGQARHATDALALAKTRAASEDVILLVDSLTRLAEEFGDTDTAKEFFDAGQAVGGSGSLTVVVALERPASD